MVEYGKIKEKKYFLGKVLSDVWKFVKAVVDLPLNKIEFVEKMNEKKETGIHMLEDKLCVLV